MTKEDIKKAKAENAERIANIAYSGGGHIGQDDLETAFENGAEWRINSVWHDINEIPEDGRIIVLLGKYGIMLIYGPNMMYYKESVIADGGFLKWAYKEDLIPNTEE